jgi:hypothetical protein
MTREEAHMAAIYVIETAGGSSSADPHVIEVKVKDEIRWRMTSKGTARIVFLDSQTVAFQQDYATPGSDAVATALKAGVHDHMIAVWVGEQEPQAVRAVLIVE